MNDRAFTGQIVEARKVDDELVRDVGRLVSQLSATAAPPSAEQLEEIVRAQGSILFLALGGGEGVEGGGSRGGGSSLLGMLALVTYRIPTGLNAVIEDVVVAESGRRAGIGSALVRAALAEATSRGARHVDLTSRASREAANQMYLKMGFERRDTNVYRYPIA